MSTAKVVQVRKAGTTDPWAILPGSTADFNVEQGEAEDTIFGASYTSNQTTITGWSISANAYYRGFAGYNSTIKKSGTPTVFTGQSMSPTSRDDEFIIDDQSLTPWNYNNDVTVNVNGTPADPDNIESIDPMFGRVVFAAGVVDEVYDVVTVTGEYLPLTAFGNAYSFDLTQNSDTTETTSFEIAQGNGGYSTHRPTLRTVSLSLSAFYRATNDFLDLLQTRDDFVVEINPDGNDKSIARGVFRVSSESNSGDVGGDEETTVELVLAVPEGYVPFSWYHEPDTTMPDGLLTILDAFVFQDNLEVRYLPEGPGGLGKEGEVVLTDASISSEVEGIVEASFDATGTGPFTQINV